MFTFHSIRYPSKYANLYIYLYLDAHPYINLIELCHWDKKPANKRRKEGRIKMNGTKEEVQN